MGQYLVCGMIAEHPYCIEKLGLRLYTIEELCYYIYHNIPLIEEDFINERLLKFIREELKLGELADRIERYYHSPADLESMLVLIQRDIAYYSEREIAKFLQQFRQYSKKTQPERKLDRADRLFEAGRLKAALSEYEEILEGGLAENTGADFKVRVLHHMGAAYMRFGLYDEALECFQAAFRELPSPFLQKQLYFWAMQTGRPYPKELESIDANSLAAWQRELSEVKEKYKVLENEKAEAAGQLSETLKQYLESEKQKYRTMAGESSCTK